jgi:hypothetical protein
MCCCGSQPHLGHGLPLSGLDLVVGDSGETIRGIVSAVFWTLSAGELGWSREATAPGRSRARPERLAVAAACRAVALLRTSVPRRRYVERGPRRCDAISRWAVSPVTMARPAAGETRDAVAPRQ